VVDWIGGIGRQDGRDCIVDVGAAVVEEGDQDIDFGTGISPFLYALLQIWRKKPLLMRWRIGQCGKDYTFIQTQGTNYTSL
jgi:hypothetical protein